MDYIAQTFHVTSNNGFSALAFIFAICVSLFSIVLLLTLPFIFVSARLRKRAEAYKNQRIDTIVAQYQPPHNLSPAEVGFLYDMKCDNKEIIATLFNLEQRGIITINSENNITVNDQNAYSGLAEYEKIALRTITDTAELGDKRPQLPITFINQNTQQEKIINIPLPYKKSLSNFTNAVQKSLKTKAIPTRSYAAALCIRALIVAVVVAFLPMLYAAIPGSSDDGSVAAWSSGAIFFALVVTIIFGIFLFPAYIGIGFATVYIWSLIAGKYWLSTKQTRALWPELEGYKQYIKTVDLDNIQFASTNKGGESLAQTLPYAIVFGLPTKWQALLDKRKIG